MLMPYINRKAQSRRKNPAVFLYHKFLKKKGGVFVYTKHVSCSIASIGFV